MKCLCVIMMLFSFICTAIITNVFARNIQIVDVGGRLHINGRLMEGACTVTTDSRDMHIDMGQYNTHSFDRVGALSTRNMPFTIRLTGCAHDVAEKVGITFSGMVAPKAPDLFLVTSGFGGPTGVSGDNGFVGLGLMISDCEGNKLIPGQMPTTFYRVDNREVALHYIARYRATSRYVYPGPLRSDVRFDISYP